MTIIFTNADFWIESHITPSLAMPDAAGLFSTPAINLDKTGRFVGGTICSHDHTDNANANAIGVLRLGVPGLGAIQYGQEITQFVCVAQKEVGAGGGVIFFKVILFMRK